MLSSKELIKILEDELKNAPSWKHGTLWCTDRERELKYLRRKIELEENQG